MKHLDEYRNSGLAKGLVGSIRRHRGRPFRFMEFCGGHTVAILKYGIRQLISPTVEMLSGPGCPVCVTANADLDKAIAMAHLPDVILTTFGDMMKVPGSRSSLQHARAEGADVRVVYSTLDALEVARNNSDRPVIFLGIGFETTAPTIAASILQAEAQGMDNYFVFVLHKLTPPVTVALLALGEVKFDGIIGPGHVSTIIGSRVWESLPRDHHMPCVISGFEPLDILQCIAMLVAQVERGQAKVEIAYRRSVRPEGNRTALALMERVFESCDANWRGMGIVPDSGLKLSTEYGRFDAERVFTVEPGPTEEPQGCACGEILRGIKSPPECPLFGGACTPVHPVGPCMVSAEGACAAHYRYGEP